MLLQWALLVAGVWRMDKDFDERMAPALHTTNHDSASEAIKNSLKHSLSSNSNPDSSPDQNIYEHVSVNFDINKQYIFMAALAIGILTLLSYQAVRH